MSKVTLRERLFELLRKHKAFLQDGERLIFEKNGMKIVLFNNGEELLLYEEPDILSQKKETMKNNTLDSDFKKIDDFFDSLTIEQFEDMLEKAKH